MSRYLLSNNTVCRTIGAIAAILVSSIAIGAIGELGGSVIGSASWAADWATVQKRGRLIIGVKDNLPPLGFKNAKGELVGFEIDIARELAKELLGSNTAVEFVPLTNRDRLSALWQDRVDLVIAQLTVTQNRARLVDFSLPYYTNGTALIAKRGTTLKQLLQSKIAVLKGSATISVLQYFLPKASLIGADSYQEGLTALQRAKVDAFAGSRVATAKWLQENQDFEQVGSTISAENFAIASPRGLQYEELRQHTYNAVEKWRKNGWLQERAKFWGLE